MKRLSTFILLLLATNIHAGVIDPPPKQNAKIFIDKKELILEVGGPREYITIYNLSEEDIKAFAIAPNFTGTELEGQIFLRYNSCQEVPVLGSCKLGFMANPNAKSIPRTRFTIKGINTNEIGLNALIIGKDYGK